MLVDNLHLMLSSQVINFIQHQFEGFSCGKLILIFLFLLWQIIPCQPPENIINVDILEMFRLQIAGGFLELKTFRA